MESIGQHLRSERELRQVSLEELAQTTRIPIKMLAHLEADRFDQLPGEVFVRGFIKSYARAIGLPHEALLEQFGARFPVEEPPPAVAAITTAPERGRRFGIAVAMVILLVLFTLALSIVLRPRHRAAPIELSVAPTSLPCRSDEPKTPTPSSFASLTTANPTASSRC